MNQQPIFETIPKPLTKILEDIKEAKIQLPDFQRGWVWDDEHIKSLLASIAQAFPIGAVLMLENDEKMHFKPRVVEGVSEQEYNPELLVLDGQQRLTSLFQPLFLASPVETQDERGNKIRRWYYIDMKKALDGSSDTEEAIVSISEERIIRNFRNDVIEDYSSPEKEYEKELFPLNKIFESFEWREGYTKFWNYREDKTKFFNDFERLIIKRFENYEIPQIKLLKGVPKEAVCLVFEKVNTGGVSLNVFELLTATYAIDDFSLRDDWDKRKDFFKKYRNLVKLESTDFLQAISLLSTRKKRMDDFKSGKKQEEAKGISCKRKDILKRTLDEYKEWADQVTTGFEKVSRLLYNQKFFTSRDIPYKTQLVPLASIFAVLGEKADNDEVRRKILRWFWCGVFGELYGSAIETRFAKDLPEVLEWIEGGEEPTTLSDASFRSSRLLTLRTRNSAAYKGLFALLMRDGGLDFKTGEPIVDQVYFEDNIDIHHIFPSDWCNKNVEDRAKYDSIVNKTPISAKTNRIIGGNAPSIYLERLQKSYHIDEERMDAILNSHVIEPSYVRSNDAEGFFKARTEELIKRVENAMGKEVLRDTIALDLGGTWSI